jgi:tRNA threonylcarbamoyladenosine biosynthesis protein TsaB
MNHLPAHILSFDTTTSSGSIVLSHGERLIGEINLESPPTHSVRLLPGIEYLLSFSEVSLEKVDAFSAIVGPGSFTGLRIGLTTLKALAQSQHKPVIPIIAFEAWVEKFSCHRGWIAPWIDARRNEVYHSLLYQGPDGASTSLPAGVGRPESIFPSISPEEVLFVGDGAVHYRNQIEAQNRAGWRIGESDSYLGRAMARVAWRKYQSGKSTTPAEVSPFYLRKSDAELAWKES